MADDSGLFLDLGKIDVGNGVVTIKDTGNFLESGTLGLNVEVVDEDKFAEVPEGVEEHEVPVVGHVVPCNLVGLVTNGEDGLDRDIHDHHALSTEMEGKDLKGVSDEQARPTDIVEDTENPDSSDLSKASALVGVCDTTIRHILGGWSCVLRVLIDTTGDGPEYETENHTSDGEKEERTTSDLINGKSSTNGDGQIENGLSSRELVKKG